MNQCIPRHRIFSTRVRWTVFHETLFPPLAWYVYLLRTYLISAPIVPYYYTQLIGDAKVPPTLLAAPSFDGFAVIGTPCRFQRDFSRRLTPYDFKMQIHIFQGAEAHNISRPLTTCEPHLTLVSSLWRSNVLRKVSARFEISWSTSDSKLSFLPSLIPLWNFSTRVPPEKQQGTGIHWQVAQATSLMNIVFEMSAAPNTAHQGMWVIPWNLTPRFRISTGIWMENGRWLHSPF